MKHRVFSGVEVMDTLRAEKHKASCIPNSASFFPLPNFFPFRIVLFGYQRCAFIFHLGAVFTSPLLSRSNYPVTNLSRMCLLISIFLCQWHKYFSVFFLQFRCRQWYIIGTKSLGSHDEPWIRANSSGKFCPQST